MEYEAADVLLFLAGTVLVIAFLAIFMVKFIVSVYLPFIDENEHIKSKIMFSTNHEERQYWLRERRRLLISYIPFIGGFIANNMAGKRKKG